MTAATRSNTDTSPAVVYFASDRSGYASGSELLVDGGWTYA